MTTKEDTSEVHVKAKGFHNMKTIILAVVTVLGAGGAGTGVGYATAKTTEAPSTVDAKNDAQDAKRDAQELEFKKQIYEKLSSQDGRLVRIEAGVDAANAASVRDMAEVKQENREMRVNDRLQDKQIADLDKRLAVQEAKAK